MFTDFIQFVLVKSRCVSGNETGFYSPVTDIRWTDLFLAAKYF